MSTTVATALRSAKHSVFYSVSCNQIHVLLPFCDRLEPALTTANTTRARLLEALLHEALDPVETPATEAAE